MFKTRNIALKYLYDQHSLNAHQARWLAFLSEYDFEAKHTMGNVNKLSNALSRSVHILHTTNQITWEMDLN